MESSFRRAARVLLVDDSDRLLMLRGIDPARPDHRYWMTVGGGLGEGESPVDGAARELAEETGLRMDAARLGLSVRHEVIEFSFDGVWTRQEQDFFLLRVPAFQISTDGFDAVERVVIEDHRWWTLAELESTTELVYPPDVAVLLARLLAEEERC